MNGKVGGGFEAWPPPKNHPPPLPSIKKNKIFIFVTT